MTVPVGESRQLPQLRFQHIALMCYTSNLRSACWKLSWLWCPLFLFLQLILWIFDWTTLLTWSMYVPSTMHNSSARTNHHCSALQVFSLYIPHQLSQLFHTCFLYNLEKGNVVKVEAAVHWTHALNAHQWSGVSWLLCTSSTTDHLCTPGLTACHGLCSHCHICHMGDRQQHLWCNWVHQCGRAAGSNRYLPDPEKSATADRWLHSHAGAPPALCWQAACWQVNGFAAFSNWF